MQIESSRFGQMEIGEKDMIFFSEGLLGFEELHRFVVVQCPQTDPINWLQSVDDPSISLPVIDPFIILPSYSIDLEEAEMDKLEAKKEEDIQALGVMVIPGDVSRCTINLSAPILVNVTNHQSLQLVIDYTNLDNAVRYPAYEGLMRYYKEMRGSAGIDAKD